MSHGLRFALMLGLSLGIVCGPVPMATFAGDQPKPADDSKAVETESAATADKATKDETSPATGKAGASSVPDSEKPNAEGASPEESAGGQKYTLAFKFQPNQVLRYEVFQETEFKSSVESEIEIVRNSSNWKRHFRVTAVDEKTGAGDLELAIDWAHMVASFDNPDKPKTDPIEFQSDDPEKHPRQFTEILRKVGKPHATIRFSPSGKLMKVVKGPPEPPPKTAPQTPRSIGIAPEGTAESFLFPLPEQPVAIGESWKERTDIFARDSSKNLVKVTLLQSYELVEVKDRRAVIGCRTTILTPVQDSTVEAQLIQREISGKIVFDLDQGLIVSRELGVEKTVVNPYGAKGSMQAKSRYREKLVAGEATADATAKAEASTATAR